MFPITAIQVPMFSMTRAVIGIRRRLSRVAQTQAEASGEQLQACCFGEELHMGLTTFGRTGKLSLHNSLTQQMKDLAEQWGMKAIQSMISGHVVAAEYRGRIAARYAVRCLK